MEKKNIYIRNFSIIAHIDHGKSTLADRLIELCGGVEEREMRSQILDSMEIEQERGITIKAQAIRLNYKSRSGQDYQLNLIDTPGHVDFGYEVSRSLAACEGSLLVVDASQGVEAQTLTNVYKAIDNNHEIITVLNKIDLPAAEPEKIKEQIEEVIGIDTSEAIEISAKSGEGVEKVLEAIVRKLHHPSGKSENALQALLVDGWYDTYLGIIILVRVIDGSIRKGTKIRMMSTGITYQVDMVGYHSPKRVIMDCLNCGEVGFITASIKSVSDCNIGDTITDDTNPCMEALPGFHPSVPVVFCGLFPVDASDYDELRSSLARLRLNDTSFSYENETSAALGTGFRCGFLGLLHLEIIEERLHREFNLELIATAPSVVYKIHLDSGQIKEIHNPADMPDPSQIKKIEEPWVSANIIVPDEYLGSVLNLCTEKRGIQKDISYSGKRVLVSYGLPLGEIVFDFHDKLKSLSKGYASFDYEIDEYKQSYIIKLGILINGEPVEAFSLLTHRSRAESRGRDLCLRLKELIPRHQFQIPIQAAIGGKIIARETVKAFRKDVTAKLYGGDVTRKKKLLQKQKKGKKKMRMIGNVEIPRKAFIDAIKIKE